MKKVLIVLLSVLLALSFVSCESDKSEEIIAVYDEYVRGRNFTNGAFYSFYDLLTYEEDGYIYYNDETTLSDNDITNRDYVGDLIAIVDDVKYLDVTSAVAKSGTIKNTSDSTDTTYSNTITFTDCVIDAIYTDNSGEKAKEGEKTTLEINGQYSYLSQYDEGKKNILSRSYTYDFSIDEISYRIELEKDADYNFTSVKVNEKSVDLRLINAGK